MIACINLATHAIAARLQKLFPEDELKHLDWNNDAIATARVICYACKHWSPSFTPPTRLIVTTHRIPIVLISNSIPISMHECFMAGFDDFLSHDTSDEQIQSCIRRLYMLSPQTTTDTHDENNDDLPSTEPTPP